MGETILTSHFRLAPSSSSRWLECPGSALAEMPNVPNFYGGREEGTDAHSWAADVLKVKCTLDKVPDYCRAGVTTYVEHVRSNQCDVLMIETKWESLSIPEHGGTIDCLLLDGKRAAFYDYKTGKWDVKAEGNTQLLCYAAIIAEHFDVEDFYGVIVQPNSKVKSGRQPKVAHFSPYQVDTHRERVAAAAMSDDLVAGQHCLFCPMLQNGSCEVGYSHAERSSWLPRYRHLQPLLG